MTDLERLAEFVSAQIKADEAAVEAWDSDGRARIAVMWTGPEPGYTTVAIDHGDDVWFADGREVVDPRHVTIMYDPARVLAECAAKKAIVEYKPPRARSTFDDGYRRGQLNMHADMLRLLAQPYADRPGFDSAWKVDT